MCKCSQIPHTSLRVVSIPPIEAKPTTICLIIYKHFTHTKLRHHTFDRCKWYLSRSSHQRCSVTKGVLRDFTKFTGKRLCQSLFLNKDAGLRPATLLKRRLWYRCFPVNFANFLRTVCNFQSMKSPAELNSLLSKFFCYITCFVISPD